MENNDTFLDPSGGRLKAGLSAAVDDNMGSTPPLANEETLDALFDGRVRLYQRRTGYRFSLDALLLACFTRLRRGEKIIDLGAGNGVVPLILAYRYPWADITGVELQEAMVKRALRNVRLNGLEDRVGILAGDVRAIENAAPGGSFHAAVCNPPFRKRASGRVSLDDEKRMARHEIEGALGDFLRAAAYLLRAKGRLTIIYPAVRAIELLAEMRQVAIEPKRMRLVHSFVDAEAALILVDGVKGGRGGVEILAPLIIYQRQAEYTDEVAGIIAGARR
jgi:tRNA1Val (adenine37-N6)-methyltransferase